MHQLESILSALDPAASESFKIISYFDALVKGHVSLDGMLRGAAQLTSCSVGFSDGNAQRRVERPGAEVQRVLPKPAWPRADVPDRSGAWVWLERSGQSHVNDAMVLERLAMSVAIVLDRASTQHDDSAVETLVSEDASREDRTRAARRLQLDLFEHIRITAMPASAPVDGAEISATFLTPAGDVRAVVGRCTNPTLRAGIGKSTLPIDAFQSWNSALAALRMTSPKRPVLEADDLGILLELAQVSNSSEDLERFQALVAKEKWVFSTADAFVRAFSVRRAAQSLGFHHSTVESRVNQLSQLMGFDIRSPLGSTRIAATFALHQFHAAHFE